MTDFSLKVPFNPEKHYELHDQTKVAPPGPPARDFVSRHLSIIVGAVFGIAFISLAFMARAGWENHREWVVALNVPPLVIGGLAVGNLLYRKRLSALGPGIVVLMLCVLFTVINVVQGYRSEGQNNWRDLLSILQGISLAIALHMFIGAFVWNEIKHPIKAPEPQM